MKYKLYLVTYKSENGSIISQFLRTGKTRDSILSMLEEEYNVQYYSLTADYICLTDSIVNKQTI